MKAKTMGAFIELSVVLGNHEQHQGCLAIQGLLCLIVSSIVLLRKPVPCGG